MRCLIGRRCRLKRIRAPGYPPVIYEYRAYTCLPGRLPALLDRFRTTTLGLWEKHGIRTAGFWTVEVGENNQVLHYLLAWGIARRAKGEVAQVRRGPGLDLSAAGRERDTRQDRQRASETSSRRPTDFSTVQSARLTVGIGGPDLQIGSR